MNLNLNALRIFAAVVEAGSFTRAAARLYISQPAVSKAVQELERQIALALLDRGAGPLRLTKAGSLLYHHAQAIFGEERAAVEALAALRGLDRGVLHVGASTTIAIYMLPPVLGAFRQRYPGIEVTLTSANTQEIAELAATYRLDVALVEGPVADPRLDVRPWQTDELVVIAAPAHPLVHQDSVALAQLAHEPFIAREPGSGTRDVAEQALRTRGVEPRTTLELGSTEAIKQAVAAGLGLAIVSRATIADQLALGTLAILDVPQLTIHRPLTELVRVGRTRSPAVAAFEPFLRPRLEPPAK